MATEKIKVN